MDYTGPTEIFSQMSYNQDLRAPKRVFKVNFIASTPTIRSDNCMTIVPDMTIEEATKRIGDFDVLVVPGGNPERMVRLAWNTNPVKDFIKAFNSAAQAKRGESEERIILSVCTGALLLAGAGVLKRLQATTHHRSLDRLGQIDGSVDVLKSTGVGSVGRYVDGGRNEQGVRVVTAGGVTCGLDASLYVSELKAGREAAERVAKMVDYEWKRG